MPNTSSNNGKLEARHSHGLEQFCASLEGSGLSVIDLAGASQQTISFLTNCGHRLYSDDFVHQLDQCFANGDFYEDQANPVKAGQFLESALSFPDNAFDGALVWDSLQFLSPSLLQIVVEKLHRILKPGASLLAFFHAEERIETIPTYSYRISDPRTILLSAKARRKPAQFFNNRSLEKVFQNFGSVKFFLTRDHLREVIVRR